MLKPLNQVIIWDKIVKSPKEAHLKEINEFVKYALIDQGQELRYEYRNVLKYYLLCILLNQGIRLFHYD